jgi:formylglycine-generating enzyme required for sulfatase activity
VAGQSSSEKQESGTNPPSIIKITHSFAVATKETSVSQYLTFRKEQKYTQEISPKEGCPIHVNFFEAMAYCRWLRSGKEWRRIRCVTLPSGDAPGRITL